MKIENRQVMVNKEMPTVTSTSLQPQMGQVKQTEYKETPIRLVHFKILNNQAVLFVLLS